MTQSTKPLSPLRQRMLEDLRTRGLSIGTQTGYIRSVKRLAQHRFGRFEQNKVPQYTFGTLSQKNQRPKE